MTDILGSAGDLDERVVAKAALEAAEEKLRSLCASHAGTFVSVERRGHALELALKDLLSSVKNVEEMVSTSQTALEQEEEMYGWINQPTLPLYQERLQLEGALWQFHRPNNCWIPLRDTEPECLKLLLSSMPSFELKRTHKKYHYLY